MSRTSEEVLNQVWECVRSHNGIMVLMDLLSVKTPITDADSIRALACKALLGLARSENARQIMGKLPLFTSNQLQVLMREPILQDKRQEHVKFQKHALELLEQVSGRVKSNVNEFEISLAKIHKADVVAQTRIQFNEKQLLQLIHQHLAAKNLHETATMLLKEAALPPLQPKPSASAFPPYRTPAGGSGGSATASTPVRAGNRLQATPSTSAGGSVTTTTPVGSGLIKLNLSASRRADRLRSMQPSPTGGLPSTPASSMSMHKLSSWEQGAAGVIMKGALGGGGAGGALEQGGARGSRGGPGVVSLDAIVTEYLMNQHALCKNPMVTCPQFDLLQPHKCPDAKSKNTAPVNFTVRSQRRSMRPPFGGADGAKLDRHLVYSRFRPVRTYRSDGETFTCCAFSPCEQFLMVSLNLFSVFFLFHFLSVRQFSRLF